MWPACCYDLIVRGLEVRCMHRLRGELLRAVAGRVLELGAGTGLNLDHYPASIEALTLHEPDQHMRRQLEKRLNGHALQSRCTLGTATAESLQPAPGAFDCVVATLVLCSVRDVSAALANARCALRTGGRLLLIEHIAAPRGSGRRKLQAVLDPLWLRVADGCHLQRDPRELLLQHGFVPVAVQQLQFQGVPGFIKSGLMGTWHAE